MTMLWIIVAFTVFFAYNAHLQMTEGVGCFGVLPDLPGWICLPAEVDR